MLKKSIYVVTVLPLALTVGLALSQKKIKQQGRSSRRRRKRRTPRRVPE